MCSFLLTLLRSFAQSGMADDSARVLHNPAGLIDGSTCDTFAKTVQAKCGHHGGILHQPPAKYWSILAVTSKRASSYQPFNQLLFRFLVLS